MTDEVKISLLLVSSILQSWPSYILHCHATVPTGWGGAGMCRAAGLCEALGQFRILRKLMGRAVTRPRGGLECRPQLLSARYISLCWGARDERADGDCSLGGGGKYASLSLSLLANCSSPPQVHTQ